MQQNRALHTFTDDAGHTHRYLLAERRVRIAYGSKKKHYFACRQITRLDEATGHQTQVLTTRDDTDLAALAHLMFSRWNQENFFRYMRALYALDALDSYATAHDDLTRLVPNPARRQADAELAAARRTLEAADATEGRAAVAGRRPA